MAACRRIRGRWHLRCQGTPSPQLDRLIADAHKRKFEVIVVWKFDRFARSVSHLLRALENFRALGIEFVSLSEQIDTSTPTGKMIFTVLGAVAELERSLIAERVRAGLRNARAKGKRLGRPSQAGKRRPNCRPTRPGRALAAYWHPARGKRHKGLYGHQGHGFKTAPSPKAMRAGTWKMVFQHKP